LSKGDTKRSISRANDPIGFLMAFFAMVLGFALIWHIWWMSIVGLLGAVVIALVRAWCIDGEIEISADELDAVENAFAAREITACPLQRLQGETSVIGSPALDAQAGPDSGRGWFRLLAILILRHRDLWSAFGGIRGAIWRDRWRPRQR
jgi:hypothetical protein